MGENLSIAHLTRNIHSNFIYHHRLTNWNNWNDYKIEKLGKNNYYKTVLDRITSETIALDIFVLMRSLSVYIVHSKYLHIELLVEGNEA